MFAIQRSKRISAMRLRHVNYRLRWPPNIPRIHYTSIHCIHPHLHCITTSDEQQHSHILTDDSSCNHLATNIVKTMIYMRNNISVGQHHRRSLTRVFCLSVKQWWVCRFFFLVLFILLFVSCLRQCAARTVQECAEVDFTFSKKSFTATAMTNWYRCWYAMPEWIGNSLRATRAARHAWHMEQNTHNTTQVQAERMVEETTYHDIMTE